MDHLDEVAGAVRSAMQVAQFGGAADALAPGRTRDVPGTRCQRLEDRIEMPHGGIRSADHHAVSALEAPDAAAGSDIHVVDPFGCKLFGAADVVHVIRVAAVDEDVAALEVRHEVGDGLVHGGRRHHQPDRTRLLQLAHQVDEGCGPDRLIPRQIRDRLRRHVEHHARMAALDEAPHHVGAHSAQSDHRELHDILLR